MSLDMYKKKGTLLDFKSDIKEFNFSENENNRIKDEMYVKWLKFGRLQDTPSNYKLYLEDMKEIEKRSKYILSDEEKEERRIKLREMEENHIKMANDLLAGFNSTIQQSKEEETIFRR